MSVADHSRLVAELEAGIARHKQRAYQARLSFAPTAAREHDARADGLAEALALVKSVAV